MARTTQTLSVRISDPEVLDQLTDYTKKYSGATQAKVVENLIRYFNEQSLEQKHLLVRGMGTDYLGLIGESLQLVTWGEHALQGFKGSRGNQVTRGSFLPWVIETYNKLDKIAADAEQSHKKSGKGRKGGKGARSDKESGMVVSKDLAGILSLRRIAWFKLGTAWIFVAKELRAQALVDLGHHLRGGASKASAVTPDGPKPKDWKRLYDAAIDSLRVAIANFHLFNKSLDSSEKDPHPTVLYNQACTWSLIAQYLAELNANNRELKSQALALLQEEETKRNEAKEPPGDHCLLASGISEAESALQRANECLQRITIVYKGDTEGMPFADAQWLFNYAEQDEDIACFRTGRPEDYKMWRDKRTTGISLLDSYMRLRPDVSKDIKEVLDRENFDAATQGD